ncbi:non-homologous end-joining DNA ligase [Paeniglutamicibacter psychrophenolicus]|uniref:non-homologous end-joining DNA ligase n=1 Tax=Paeniglutamicibacter psychrophenolicus TaxID=257454 RepID=UPI0027855122|nr:non-homologous end-joining DNA ligase [Paeniglutamicibacter psychrophenolicus]MDQ0092407.1 DNA ligase D-like protein (predicted polymerase) [Paeniglutamicibacter psychrophenolicus]
MSAQELHVDGGAVRFTHPGKVLYPETGTTKLDVAMYYMQVAPVMIPWARDRPATRKRWIDGVGTGTDPGKSFFQKNLDASTPEWVLRQRMQHKDHVNIYPMVNDARTLVWLAQTATLEIHAPQWRFSPDGTPQHPDRMVLDLDPGEGAGLPECAAVALLVKESLAQMGVVSLPVTSGRKGLHVYAELDGKRTSDEVARLAHELAMSLESEYPEMVVSRMDKELRRGKVLVDWSQNWPGKTTVVPYSLRGSALPTVAAPRRWEEIDAVDLAQLDYREVLARIEAGIVPGL